MNHFFHLFTRWKELSFEGISVPAIQYTEAGNIQFSWDTNIEYLDVDVFPDGRIDWFYRNRRTNEIDGTEEPENCISQTCKDRLKGLHVKEKITS